MSDDARAIAELAAVSDADAPHKILHYIYVPSPEAGAVIAKKLQHLGFQTEESPGADGVNWLVLATQEVVPSEVLLDATRRSMEALVETVGGEYDGWEAEVISWGEPCVRQ